MEKTNSPETNEAETASKESAKLQKIKDMTDAAIEVLLSKTLKTAHHKFAFFKADSYPYLVSVSTKKNRKLEFEIDGNFREQIAAMPEQIRRVEELLEAIPNLKRVYKNIS